MSVMDGDEIAVMSIEECQRLEQPLRRDLEVLDYEVRSLIARMRAEAKDAGADEMLFVKASTTVLLSIAAGLVARAAEDKRAPFDATSFVASADSAAQWAQTRRMRYFVAGEA
ncbi:hypothetical protein [Methylocystis sp. ATCC 49242]|uniref:hypothetical protein n=1 Tax=Methylocystis sp. ATCC 49242 TaxID=622637 RepID=UPI0001F8736D|nr:hypothetical protein [Methylocystis sp. ATCC 49242]